MPNKYSHALVLSNYESRGLIKFPHSPPSSYVAPLPVEARLRVGSRSQTPVTDGRALVDQSRSITPLEPTAAIESPQTHRPTPSIITEIYAPERTSPRHKRRQSISPDPSLASLSILDSDWEEDGMSFGTNSLTTSTSARSSSVMRSTPRSSVSPILESPILGAFEDLPPCRDIFPIPEDHAATPWEELQTPAVCRIQSLDLIRQRQPPTARAAPSPPARSPSVRSLSARSSSVRSPSPDDAAPPPIARYRRVSYIPVRKTNRTSTISMKPGRSKPYPETAPSADEKLNSDRLRGNRTLLGDWILGNKLER